MKRTSGGGLQQQLHKTTVMSKPTSARQRFDKPLHFFSKAGKQPHKVLREIFQNYELRDLQEGVRLWQQLALANDQSAYEEGAAREDLMDFIQDLQRLIEAFSVCHQKNDLAKNSHLEALPKRDRKKLQRMNSPIILTKQEQQKPRRVIRQFCHRFRKSYVQMELLDLLDAVITYTGSKTVYKGHLVLFYQHLYYLVRLAYRM